MLGGLGYGLILTGVNVLLRFIRDPWLLYAYLFAMIWLAAVGGNLTESLDKLLAAAAPGVLGFALLRLRFVPRAGRGTIRGG